MMKRQRRHSTSHYQTLTSLQFHMRAVLCARVTKEWCNSESWWESNAIPNIRLLENEDELHPLLWLIIHFYEKQLFFTVNNTQPSFINREPCVRMSHCLISLFDFSVSLDGVTYIPERITSEQVSKAPWFALFWSHFQQLQISDASEAQAFQQRS